MSRKRHKMKYVDLMKIKKVTGEIDYEGILAEYSQQTVTTLKSPSVSPHSDRPGRATPYRLGWAVTEADYRTGHRYTVWNKTNWQLTHLLENGHFITNRTDGIKWVSPRPHIRPTYDRIEPRFVRAMRKAKPSIDIS